MSAAEWMLVIAIVASVNPPRVVAAMASAERRRPERLRVALLGCGTVLAILVVGMSLAGTLVDALDVGIPTSRMAVGVIVGFGGLRTVLVGPPSPGPELDGLRAGLVPLAFPVLARPEPVIAAVLGSADRGFGVALVGVLVGLTLVVVAMTLVGGHEDDTVTGRFRELPYHLLGGVAVVAGIDILLNGLLDVSLV